MNKKRRKKVVEGKVLLNKEVGENICRIDIEAPFLGKNSKPGQFINIKAKSGVSDPLLRIPLGIHKIRKTGISLLYKVVGPGTALLKEKRKGETVDILGPLGNGFDLAESGNKHERAVLVAGGYGVSPLFALAEELIGKGKNVNVLMGGKTKTHVTCEKELKKMGVKVVVMTDDGTYGKKGHITEALIQTLNKMSEKKDKTIIFACGPEAMLASVSGIAAERGIKAQITKDEYMACGVGACRGCAVKTKEGYKLSCTDGPVFESTIIEWE